MQKTSESSQLPALFPYSVIIIILHRQHHHHIRASTTKPWTARRLLQKDQGLTDSCWESLSSFQGNKGHWEHEDSESLLPTSLCSPICLN